MATIFIPSAFLALCLSGILTGFAKDDLSAHRDSLSKATSEGINDAYSFGLEAFVSLMQADSDGYEILSQSWANDVIPESTWLNWRYDFVSRWSKGADGDPSDFIEQFDRHLLTRRTIRLHT